MLAVKGLPEGARPTIVTLSQRLGLRHHSTVELINRLAAAGFIRRKRSEVDGREMLIELTAQGERLLRRLSLLHWEEWQTAGPALSDALKAIVKPAK